jgi:hypothetical protein
MNRYTFYFFSLLVANGVFREVYVNFMLVGHTHEDIDALFGRWSMRLQKHDYPTVVLVMKSFMDGESISVIPHLIEEVPNFKDFIDTLSARKAKLWKDTLSHKPLNSTEIITVGLLCNTSIIAQMQSGCLRKVEEYVFGKRTMKGKPILPTRKPSALAPQQMRNHFDIAKGLEVS